MLKDFFDFLDFKTCLREGGIFLTLLYFLFCFCFLILSIPFLPFYLLNEWSKKCVK